ARFKAPRLEPRTRYDPGPAPVGSVPIGAGSHPSNGDAWAGGGRPAPTWAYPPGGDARIRRPPRQGTPTRAATTQPGRPVRNPPPTGAPGSATAPRAGRPDQGSRPTGAPAQTHVPHRAPLPRNRRSRGAPIRTPHQTGRPTQPTT